MGGKYAYNDFCGAIWQGEENINYIGKAVLKAPPPEYADKKGTRIATGCSICHGPTIRRVPWHELGYGPYPEIAFSVALLIGLLALVGLFYLLPKR